MSIVTLLTDFGTEDYYVGAMKGAVLAADPGARLVDITHEVAAHDVEGAAFTLAAACETFPEGTVHVAVVDPGVGSARRPLAVSALGRFFVGPDNGLFTHVYDRDPGARVFHVTNDEHFRRPVSATFHGRDVFAPVAGALSRGVAPESLGPAVRDAARLDLRAPRRLDARTLEASVIHVDRFGNCVTNVSARDLSDEALARGVALAVNGREVTAFRRFYADEAGGDKEPFLIRGSAGLLEISVNRDSAARLLDIRRGDTVKIVNS